VLRDTGHNNKRWLLRKLDSEALRKMAEATDALNEAADQDG
jgi:hypothetical protein